MNETTVVLPIEYIVQTPGVCAGRPRIAGRRVPVHTVVYPVIRHGATVEDTAETFSLSPAQVHAALAYYYDHRQEMESLMDEWERELDDEEVSEREIAALAGATHMTVTQVAEEFDLDDSTVRKAIYEKRLPAVKAGGVWLVARKGAEELWRKRDRRRRPRKPRQP